MTTKKNITIKMSGSPAEYNAAIAPNDTPREVLAKTIDADPDGYILRKGTEQIPKNVNLFEIVEDGEKLTGATNPVVG